MITILDTGCETHHAGRQVDYVAADVERVILQRLFAEITLRVTHEIQHLLGDRAGTVRTLAAEEVERHAVRRRITDVDGAHRDLQLRSVVRVLFLLETTVVAVACRQVPVEVAIGALKLTLQTGRQHVGVDVLEEQASARLDRTASEKLEVAVRDRKILPREVVGIRRRDQEVVGDAGTATVTEAQRFRSRLGL